jgi:hypothetical protein
LSYKRVTIITPYLLPVLGKREGFAVGVALGFAVGVALGFAVGVALVGTDKGAPVRGSEVGKVPTGLTVKIYIYIIINQ